MKKNMFTETEMTALLFTHEKRMASGVLQEGIELLNYAWNSTAVWPDRIFVILSVAGAAEQVPHQTIDLGGTERGAVI